MAYGSTQYYKPLIGEELRDIDRAPGYKISNLGRVISWMRTKPRILKSYDHLCNSVNQKYQVVDLRLPNGKKWRPKIHTLVLTAFVGPRPENMQCCHNNGDPRDNRLINLRWDTPENNQHDRKEHGTWARATAPKTEAHKQKIRENMKRIWAERKAAQAQSLS